MAVLSALQAIVQFGHFNDSPSAFAVCAGDLPGRVMT
jgi:hypothetical protein